MLICISCGDCRPEIKICIDVRPDFWKETACDVLIVQRVREWCKSMELMADATFRKGFYEIVDCHRRLNLKSRIGSFESIFYQTFWSQSPSKTTTFQDNPLPRQSPSKTTPFWDIPLPEEPPFDTTPFQHNSISAQPHSNITLSQHNPLPTQPTHLKRIFTSCENPTGNPDAEVPKIISPRGSTNKAHWK